MFKFFTITVFVLLLCSFNLFGQNAWINEIHYDNVGADVNEMVEIVLEDAGSYTLSNFTLYLYNGSSTQLNVYDQYSLDTFTEGATINNFTFFSVPTPGIQNGSPDGLALAYMGVLIPGQFLSYEGTFTPIDGPAIGIESVNIGVSEDGTTPIDSSLQLLGSGIQYSDFIWAGPVHITAGLPNSDGMGGDQSLPVELTSFTARAGNGQVTLNWKTASETNNLGYAVLRSMDKNGVYNEIDSYVSDYSLEGAGNSSISKSYSYIDNTVINDITYWYKLVDVDFNGIRTEHGPVHVTPRSDAAEVNPVNDNIPAVFDLAQNFPNPFNPSTRISFDIPELKQDLMDVKVTVYDMLGKKVKTLLKSAVEAGHFELEWNGTNEYNIPVPSGIYVYQFQSDLFNASKKMVLMR